MMAYRVQTRSQRRIKGQRAQLSTNRSVRSKRPIPSRPAWLLLLPRPSAVRRPPSTRTQAPYVRLLVVGLVHADLGTEIIGSSGRKPRKPRKKRVSKHAQVVSQGGSDSGEKEGARDASQRHAAACDRHRRGVVKA